MTGAPVTAEPVPVLLYHAITENPGRHIAPFAVGPGAFKAQLDCLVGSDVRCISFSQLIAERSSDDATERSLRDRRRTAVITFDDGYADFAGVALPALLERSLPCTLYVTTGWLEGGPTREPGPGDRMLSWSAIAEVADAGCEIGAHSHSHPHLDTLSTAALREELVRPKALLEDALGREIHSVAYPHGYHGPRVRRLTDEAGYRSGAAVRNRVSPAEEDRLRISRLTITASTTSAEVLSWLRSGPESRRQSDREAAGTKGWRIYRRSRAVLRGRPGSDYR